MPVLNYLEKSAEFSHTRWSSGEDHKQSSRAVQNSLELENLPLYLQYRPIYGMRFFRYRSFDPDKPSHNQL